MAKQLNVNLAFTADASQAKAQIESLKHALSEVATLPAKASSLFDDASIQKASQAALELEQHLLKAVNVDTGKLDLSRFASSLKANNKDLNTYCSTLLSVGPTGQQAFLMLAQSIAAAEMPMTRINKRLVEFGTTLKNTARWQISSSILHGFMGAISSAYGYAQDLNESLNNIRIVTGKSAETMGEFAEKANKAAKALSATTTEYTDAALIFYQQGLSENEVEERTNVTLKMAHAAGESATEVSSYMTAIWNNFDDGSKSLEYYGDVMTHLGAKTAASTAEIAEGMEKFAAIGETIGLSYEYAASTVATVVDKTRQSAEVVGTAFKTIFARLQGLQLGETLDDGTDLNKYSSALQSVGISIKDTYGQLKDANVILDELGEKWKTLEKDEKTALAQTVAGVRQYTQLMSLMNNYDSFKANVASASAAEGTLSVQADIYASSWEAAQDRVTAAAENIYDSLLDDSFFITLLNGFEKVLDTIGGLVDGLGGMKGVITLISSLFLTSFAQKIPAVLTSLKQNLMVFTGQATKEMQRVQSELGMKLTAAQSTPGISSEYKAQLEGVAAVNNMKQKLIVSSQALTEQEREEYSAKIRNVDAMYKEIAALEKKKDALEKTAKESAKALAESAKTNAVQLSKDFNTAVNKADKHSSVIQALDNESKSINRSAIANGGNLSLDNKARLAQIEQERAAHVAALVEAREKADELDAELDEVVNAFHLSAEAVQQLAMDGKLSQEALAQISAEAQKVATEFSSLVTNRTNLEDMRTAVNGQAKAWQDSAKAITQFYNQNKKQNFKATIKEIDQLKKNMTAYITKIQQLAKEKGLKLSQKQISELLADVKDLNTANVERVADSFKKFADVVDKEANVKIDEMDTKLDSLRNTMSSEMHFSDEAINGLEQTAGAAADVNTQLDATRENVNRLGEESPEGVFALSTAVTQFGSAVMSASMLINSWQSMMTTFTDSSATGLEKVGAVLAVLTATMSTFTAIQALATTLSKADAMAKMGQAAGQAAANLMAKIGIGIKSAETGVVIANTAAWYANPVMWIALVVMGVVAAVAALIAGVAKLTEWLIKGNKIGTENCDTLIENAKKTKELSDANDELSTSIDDLISRYHEMNDAGEDTTDILNELISKMPELIKSYRELSKQAGLGLDDDIDALERLMNLAELTGDYSGVEEKKAEIDSAVAIGVAKETQAGAQAAGTVLAAKMQDTNAKHKNGKLSTKMGGFQGGGAADDEVDAVNIMLRELDDRFVESYQKNKHAITVKIDDYSNPAELVTYYEQLVAARDAMLREMSMDQINESGTFAELDELIKATAEEYTAAKEQLDSYLGAAGDAITAEMGSTANIDSIEEYIQYQNEYIKLAQKQYGLSEEQAKAYLKENEALSAVANKYELATSLLSKYMNVEDINLLDEKTKAKYLESVELLTQDLSDEDIELAVSLVATTDSIDEFESQIQHLSAQRQTMKYDTMATDISTTMVESQKEGSFTQGQISSLTTNDDFMSFMAEKNIESAGEFTALNYDDQYAMVAEFYSKVQALRHESSQYQKQLYYDNLMAQQETLDKLYAMDKDTQEKMLADKAAYAKKEQELNKDDLTDKQKEKIQSELDSMKENFEDTYDISIEANISDVKNKMQQIEDAISQLDKQQIELAIKWDGISEIEGAFQNVSDFASLMMKDAQKVGNSYQITAQQAREWAEVYPELFSQAEVTSEGIITLDENVVNAYLEGQNAEVDATVDAKILELQAERALMEEKLAMAQADLDAAAANLQGKAALENTSAEYLSNLRKGLTQEFIDLGADEQTANAEALRAMGLNEEEYSELISAAAEKNAQNQMDSAKDGAKSQSKALSWLAQQWKKFTTLLKKVAAAVKAALTGKDVSEAWASIEEEYTGDEADYEGADLSGYKFGAMSESEITAVREKVNLDLTAQLESNKANLQKALDSIDSQIVYLQALKNQDISDFGSSDIDDVKAGKGTGDEKDTKKDIEELVEVSERYHEITREIEAQERALERLSKEKDRAYGSKKIALINEEIAALKKLEEKQGELLKLQTAFLALDKAKVMETFSNAQFDENGNISNYTMLLQSAADQLNVAKTRYNESQSEADKETLEAAEAEYKKQLEILSQYEETLDAWNNQIDVIQDIQNQIQDLNYEKIQYKLEVKMEINDAEMRMLDYYLNKLSDDFYSMAEAAQLMIDKVPLMTTALGNYEAFYNEIEAAYAAGDISQEAYVDGLKQSYDGILNNLEALSELDKEMMHYYEDTLAAGQEELAHYTDRMEHLTSVLDHYHNLIVMINGEYDYDSIGTVLEGKASTIKNELEVASANYEMLLEQQALIQSHYDNAVDENARALHAEELKAINAQVDEAHELMLAKTEEWAEAQKAIMENTMAKAAREMEMAFTNNMGFDALSNSLNRLSATADVYLTETNKIYETQTLINKAQKDIDKTTNNAAKVRLKNYQEEIELLQDKNKLTKVELDIAKAKYDVLLAEIALEEAQNAKSTVRLQRDSEGNYGYVYTADQSKVAEAEQNLLDTQNALYNIRLDAANEYGQKIMELNQQLADDLMALEEKRISGQISSEEAYEAEKERILNEYEAAYEAYASVHEIAVKDDARIEQDAWTSAYSNIINSADNWQQKVNDYTDACERAYSDYRSTVSTESEVINKLLNDVEGSVKDVTKESDNLKNKVKNEVIPQIRDQYTKVANVTAAYAAQRTGILNLIKTYEQLAASILKAMQAQANLKALEETPTGPTVPQTPTNNKTETKPTVEDTSAQDKARAKALALEAQEIVTKVHTGAIPMHSSGLGWQPSAREQGYSEDAIKVALQAFNDSKPGAGWDYYYDIALQLASRYNTGGYTGAWGPDGRMAILDEKELVLNQHDTENFLMATEILRSIVDIIDFNSLHNQMSWLSSAGFTSAGAGPLEQSVSIEAHFPNVSDRNEIEEAFNNLINTASQYANRKF